MRRRPRRHSHLRKGKVAGWIYGGIGAAVVAGIVATGILLNLGQRDTDRESGCPTDHFDSMTAVLVDLTDPITPTQAAALRNALLRIRNEIPKFGRLEIYPLEPTTTEVIKPLFAGCSPGSGRDVDNRYYGNPALADRIWHKRFADRVDAVAADIQKLEPQDSSPLFEGVQSVAVTAFGHPLAENAADKRLVIVSDMIHHTADLSMYQGAPTFAKLKNGQYYRRIKPSLRGAKLDVFLIVRETRKDVQQPPLYKFWVEFATAGDGFLRDWEPLQ